MAEESELSALTTVSSPQVHMDDSILSPTFPSVPLAELPVACLCDLWKAAVSGITSLRRGQVVWYFLFTGQRSPG